MHSRELPRGYDLDTKKVCFFFYHQVPETIAMLLNLTLQKDLKESLLSRGPHWDDGDGLRIMRYECCHCPYICFLLF